MARKLTVGGIVAVAAFYLLSAPAAAAHAVGDAGTSVQHVGHQLAVFLKALG